MDAKGKVIFPKDVLFTIIASCYRFANPSILKSKWAEVQGILYGFNEGDNVHITRAVPLAHLSSVAVEMQENDYVLVARLESEMASKNLFQIGWFHSHPGIKLFLSLEDVKTQAGLQAPNPLAIALVFNPVYLMEGDEEGVESLGIKIFRLDDANTIEIKFHEVPFEIENTGSEIIADARALLHNVQRFLRGENVFDTIQTKMEKTYKKINSEVYGLKSYLQNMKKTSTAESVVASFTNHKNRIQKLFTSKKESIDIQISLLDYLELSETLKYSERIKEIKEEWDSYKDTFPQLMDEVEKSTFN
ncbi:MAG: hypothetical protein ACTSUE_25760 [Promethearchaeota archaeon]